MQVGCNLKKISCMQVATKIFLAYFGMEVVGGHFRTCTDGVVTEK
jgi:hypothetical protein